MPRKIYILFVFFLYAVFGGSISLSAQINTEQVLRIGANTNYFEDYVLSIQYFNQVIAVNPKLAKPYFYRAIAKLNLEDFAGAEVDATLAIERNPFITDAFEVRGVARQNQGKNSQAINDYDRVLEMMPDSRGVLFNKAMAQTETKDFKGATETFETLIRKFPRFDNAFIGRSRLKLLMKDTIGAKEDIDKALGLNTSSINAYLIRADIYINSDKDYKSALTDLNTVIRLNPEFAGYYVHRAYLKYMTDDIYGAFEDYEEALKRDPLNKVARFNRGLLRAEVHDTNNAIDDFSAVLEMNPGDYKTLYNRSLLYAEIGDYNHALSDINKVIEAFPDFAAAYFLRYDINRRNGKLSAAEKDYNKSLALAKTDMRVPTDREFAGLSDESDYESDDASSETPRRTETQEQVKKRFSSLTTMSTDYENEGRVATIRGKVQDQDLRVELEPLFIITYYTSPSEIKLNNEYIREVNDLNATGLLRFILQVTNHEAGIKDPSADERHRSSIEFYNSYIANHSPRAIDFFGRAMDFYTIGDYSNAIKDLDKAISLTPDFALAYLLRSQVKYISKLQDNHEGKRNIISPDEITDIISDIDFAIKFSPFMPIAYYNRAVILSQAGMLEDAVKDFSKAIELKRNFGEAFYNRGYVYLTMGDKDKAFPDLSHAGEMGIVPAYSLLKRMTAN